MSVIEERNAEILRPQLKLIAQGRSRVLDVPPEVGNRDRVSIKTRYESLKTLCRNHPECRGLLAECPTAYPLRTPANAGARDRRRVG
jgi:hypothetical protein